MNLRSKVMIHSKEFNDMHTTYATFKTRWFMYVCTCSCT